MGSTELWKHVGPTKFWRLQAPPHSADCGPYKACGGPGPNNSLKAACCWPHNTQILCTPKHSGGCQPHNTLRAVGPITLNILWSPKHSEGSGPHNTLDTVGPTAFWRLWSEQNSGCCEPQTLWILWTPFTKIYKVVF